MTVKLLKKWLIFLAIAFLFVGVLAKDRPAVGTIEAHRLPREAQATLALIKQGGPFPYAQDGRVFGNYEGVLPKQKRGYYHEFTVRTPGARNRGAKRIVSGGDPTKSGEYYYTEDHYATFKRIIE